MIKNAQAVKNIIEKYKDHFSVKAMKSAFTTKEQFKIELAIRTSQ